MHLLGFIDLALWLIVLQLLSFAVLPYLAWMAPGVPDRGYALSKVVGFFAFASTCWVLSVCGVTSENNLLIKAVFLAFIGAGWLGYRRGLLSNEELRSLLRQYGRSVEGVFLGLTFAYLIIRFFNPEIFWGEKPMDLTFLGFFVRNETLPPQDPWAAGSPMSYYYVGIYYVAALLKLTAIPVPIGYNLAIATLAGWIGASLYGLFLLVTRRVWFATSASLLLLFVNDPELLRLVFVDGKPLNFDTFWAATRVFVSPNFFEYTSWSLLFADLHAHVIAIPFTVTVLALSAMLFLGATDRFSRKGIVHRALLGSMHGALFGINAWDFITFGAVVGILMVCAQVKPFWTPPKSADGRDNIAEIALVTVFTRGVCFVWDALIIGASAGVMVWLYQRGVSFAQASGWGWVTTPEFNRSMQFVRTLGYWMFVTLSTLIVLAIVKVRSLRGRSVLGILGAIAVAAFALLPYFMSVAQGYYRHPIGIIAYCGVAIGLAYFVLWSCAEAAERRLTALFIAMPAFLMIVVELFFLIDRMNTIFKGYMAVWMLTSVSCMLLLFFVGQAAWKSGRRGLRYTFTSLLGIFVSLQLIGGFINVYATVDLKRVPVRFWTLDGTAFLPEMQNGREDAQAIAWLNQNVKGTATILEAHGDSYREFTRISMNTGLPTVLGWEHHTRQRGLSEQALLERKKAIRAIYSSDDIALTKNLLVKYGIDFIVIGQIERASNRPFYPEKFDGHPEIFKKVVSFGSTHIYVTYFSKFNPDYQSGEPA